MPCEKVLNISGAVSISSLLSFTSFQLLLGRFHVSFQHAKTSSSFTFSDPMDFCFFALLSCVCRELLQEIVHPFLCKLLHGFTSSTKSWVFWCLFVSRLSLQSGSKYVHPLHFIQIYVFLKKSQFNATQLEIADSPPGYLITYPFHGNRLLSPMNFPQLPVITVGHHVISRGPWGYSRLQGQHRILHLLESSQPGDLLSGGLLLSMEFPGSLNRW